MIDPQGRAWCDGTRHNTGDRPRAVVMFTMAGPGVQTGHLCVDCTEHLCAQYGRSIAEATTAAGASGVIGGTITVSPLPQVP